MASGKGKAGLLNKVYFLMVLTAGLALAPVVSFAQDQPCSGDDPYETNCPLDNYVWVIAIFAIFAGAIFIYKQQKAQAKA